MKIVFDFDHTLFNMNQMYQRMVAAFSVFGVTENQFETAYHQVTEWKLFSPKDLADKLNKLYGVDSKKAHAVLLELAHEAELYVYEDVIATFTTLKEAGHDVYILSWGNKEWQDLKLKKSGLLDHVVEGISIDTMKSSYLLKTCEDSSCVLFIDDKPAEIRAVAQVHPDINCVRMRRENGKYSEEETPENIFEARDMKDILHHVALIS